MKKFTLNATKRTIIGKKVKQLRKQGLMPANIFGNKIKSEAVSVKTGEFGEVYKQAGQTSLVELDIDGKKPAVLIQNTQIHPLTGNFMHADFYQVDLKQKVKTHVPVEIMGIAPAVEQKLGVMLELMDEIEIEALPTELPEKLEVNVISLKAVGDAIKVSDIKMPSGVTVLTKADTEIVKIGELLTKEAEKQAAEEAAQKAAAAAATAATAVPAEGAPATTPTTAATTPTAEAPKAEAKPKS